MSRPPSPRMETRSLVGMLARAGWGELSGRECGGYRAVLRALVDSTDYTTGRGDVYLEAIADRAGLSVRWTSRCMSFLEQLGLVIWHRGGAACGKAVKGTVLIIKRALVTLIKLARPSHNARVTKARKTMLERIRGLKRVFSKSKKTTPIIADDSRPELSDGQPTFTGGRPRSGSSHLVHNFHRSAGTPESKATRRESEETVSIKIFCQHGVDARECPICVKSGHAPDGYYYDMDSRCHGCNRTRAACEKIIHDAFMYSTTPDEAASFLGDHTFFEPQLKRAPRQDSAHV